MKPNSEAIAAEIAKLKEMKPNVRHFTMFNDDNHAAIEAQIEVLMERLDEDEVYKRFDDMLHEMGSALEAVEWLDGDKDEPPSAEWQSLVG